MVLFLWIITNDLTDRRYYENTMMREPPKPSAGDEICPICKNPKSEHSAKKMLECSQKIIESKKHDDAG